MQAYVPGASPPLAALMTVAACARYFASGTLRARADMLDFIQDVLIRQWNDLLARPSGPMAFRFVLQPVMAAIAAIRAGIVDSRTGRSPYFLTILTNAAERGPRIREGLASTSRIMILGLVMDTIYQIVALKKFYPVEALIVAFALAVVPYFLIRGPAARIARWWHERHPQHPEHTGR